MTDPTIEERIEKIAYQRRRNEMYASGRLHDHNLLREIGEKSYATEEEVEAWTRMAKMADTIKDALAIIDELLVVNRECQERCICQCPMGEHENYGEDGFSCGEGHECLLASTAVCVAVAEQRREIERLREKVETQENALMEMGEYD